MTSAIIKSSNMVNFPYKVHIYEGGALKYGKFFPSLLSVQAYLIANNIDKFVSAL